MSKPKKKYAYDLCVSEESILRDDDFVSRIIEHCLRDLRSKNWFVYEIEEVDPHREPGYDEMYGITKYRFHLQKLQSPTIKIKWCKARLIEEIQ